MSKSKVYTVRDSATAALRKAGIDKALYSKYIKVVDGGFTIDSMAIIADELKSAMTEAVTTKTTAVKKAPVKKVVAAKTPTKKAVATKAPTKKPATKPKKVPTVVRYEEVKPPKAPQKQRAPSTKVTVASEIRRMVKLDKSNGEIWAVIQPQFDLPDSKKWYPSWYRSEMKRKGL